MTKSVRKATQTKEKVAPRFKTSEKTIKKRSKKESSDITYRRRRSYYTDPNGGGRGVCIKQRRMMRIMRQARESFPEEFRVLLTHSKNKKQHFSESFATVAVGGLDALANRTMEIASILCKNRTGTKDDKGLPMSRGDIIAAIKLIKQMK